jgi:hypothetical protein
MQATRPRWAGGLLVAVLLIAGCSGDGLCTVAGSVTVDGQPAQTGSIAFFPVDGKSQTTGATIKAGRYTARVPPGLARVQIRVPKVVGQVKLYNTPDSPYQDKMEETLPERYNNKTELRLEVKPGRNQKDWELKTR